MISFIDFLHDLTNPALSFLPKALIIAVISSIVCGVVGTHVVLRGMAFIGDAVAHSVFPGIAIAFALQTSVIAGGAVAGVVVAVLIAVFSQRRRVKEDTLIGIFFAGAFALGLVVISQIEGYTASLTNFLFGSIAGVADSEIIVAFVAGTIITAVLLLVQKELVAVSLDRETAQAQRLPVFVLDLVLYLAVTIAVIISVRTIGNILVLALLVTPAASARILTDKLSTMMLISVALGVLSSVVGLYLSWAIDVPTGATIVLVATAVFFLVWLFAPRRGVVTERLMNSRRKK